MLQLFCMNTCLKGKIKNNIMVVHWLSNKYKFINIELFLYINEIQNNSLLHVFGCNIKGMNSRQKL